MRGRLAAACAAVLVGLSPAGALPFASFAAAVSCQTVESSQPLAERPVEASAARTPRTRDQQRVADQTTRVVWRSPSGPAPSQAPPAPLA